MQRLLLPLAICLFSFTPLVQAQLRAGAAVVDVTPEILPVIVNGSMTSRSTDKIKTRLNARGLAFAEGTNRIVMLVVDSCMMPRPLLDRAKKRAAAKTGIPVDRMMISSTHTHSAGSCMGALGTPADTNYVGYLEDKLVEAIEATVANMQPARVGFARTLAPDHTAVRRWIRRPDRLDKDPFGNPTVRANMHAANKPDNVTGPSGPEDPELSMISVSTASGEPLAVLANYSMHYYSGEQGLSADYFGLFAEELKRRLAPEGPFVGIMSHGCSGDIWRKDYERPATWNKLAKIEEYSSTLVDLAVDALRDTIHDGELDLAMAEQRMTLDYRVPDVQHLEWAQRVVAEMGGRLPKTRPEIYAQEAVLLHERQRAEVVTQALRIGDIAIATTPNETYAITGLKLKASSPLNRTMVIELANGGDGYIPPPEQHLFGGYNTWPARTAGLEVLAEPKITESCRMLLEEVAGKPRRPVGPQARGPKAEAIAKLEPLAWYRLDEFAGPLAHDASPNLRHALYEAHNTFYLPGPESAGFVGDGGVNRAAMFVGGRVRARLPELTNTWTASVWIWNGMPNDGREFTGWFLSQGHDHGLAPHSIHLGLGGRGPQAGKLVLQFGPDQKQMSGDIEIPRWTWAHVALVRDVDRVRVYLNGEKEIAAEIPKGPNAFDTIFLGGRSDNRFNWEGRLDEAAFFGQALSAKEANSLFK